jgi:hypothetical protein
MRSEHRHARLLFKRAQPLLDPGEGLRIGDVHQAHRAAGVQFAGRSFAARLLIREGVFLNVARRAGLRPISRHARVVKKIAAQFHLRRRHRIIRGHVRLGKPLRQIPLVGALRAGQRGKQKKTATPHYFLNRTSVILSSIRSDRAPRFSFGTTSRRGP